MKEELCRQPGWGAVRRIGETEQGQKVRERETKKERSRFPGDFI